MLHEESTIAQAWCFACHLWFRIQTYLQIHISFHSQDDLVCIGNLPLSFPLPTRSGYFVTCSGNNSPTSAYFSSCSTKPLRYFSGRPEVVMTKQNALSVPLLKQSLPPRYHAVIDIDATDSLSYKRSCSGKMKRGCSHIRSVSHKLNIDYGS